MTNLMKERGLIIIIVIMGLGLVSAYFLLFGEKQATVLEESYDARVTVISPEPYSEVGTYLVRFELTADSRRETRAIIWFWFRVDGDDGWTEYICSTATTDNADKPYRKVYPQDRIDEVVQLPLKNQNYTVEIGVATYPIGAGYTRRLDYFNLDFSVVKKTATPDIAAVVDDTTKGATIGDTISFAVDLTVIDVDNDLTSVEFEVKDSSANVVQSEILFYSETGVDSYSEIVTISFVETVETTDSYNVYFKAKDLAGHLELSIVALTAEWTTIPPEPTTTIPATTTVVDGAFERAIGFELPLLLFILIVFALKRGSGKNE